jgi:cell division protein FtsW (lipid II flippase)
VIAPSSRAGLRRVETFTVVYSGLLVCLAFVLLSLAETQQIGVGIAAIALIFVASSVATSLVLAKLAPSADQLIFPIVVLLSGMGLVEIYRLDHQLAVRQLTWLVIGDIVLLVVMRWPRDVNWLRLYKYTWASIGFALIAVTIVHGSDVGASGYRRWIGLGPIVLQPVEFLKIFMVIFFAAYLDEKRELLDTGRLTILGVRLPPFQYLVPLLVMWGVSLLLLVRQNDLGSALLFLGIFLAVMYIGTSRAIYPVLGGALFLIGAVSSYFVFSHVKLRTDIWLNPWHYGSTWGFQIIQGLFAFAAGGIAGQGLGLGAPDRIPVAASDFIWAALGEELGLAALIAFLLMYLLLIFRGLDIASRARIGFQKLLAAGLVSIFAVQAIVIIGGNTRLIPLTGVPLPFLSYGGSSIIANFAIVGLLLKMSNGLTTPSDEAAS